jgi:hypothetical protein
MYRYWRSHGMVPVMLPSLCLFRLFGHCFCCVKSGHIHARYQPFSASFSEAHLTSCPTCSTSSPVLRNIAIDWSRCLNLSLSPFCLPTFPLYLRLPLICRLILHNLGTVPIPQMGLDCCCSSLLSSLYHALNLSTLSVRSDLFTHSWRRLATYSIGNLCSCNNSETVWLRLGRRVYEDTRAVKTIFSPIPLGARSKYHLLTGFVA